MREVRVANKREKSAQKNTQLNTINSNNNMYPHTRPWPHMSYLNTNDNV